MLKRLGNTGKLAWLMLLVTAALLLTAAEHGRMRAKETALRQDIVVLALSYAQLADDYCELARRCRNAKQATYTLRRGRELLIEIEVPARNENACMGLIATVGGE